MYCIPQCLSLAQRLLVSYCFEVTLPSFKNNAISKKMKNENNWTTH